MKRVFLIVLDSVGIGELPDAADFNDTGSNTLRAAFSSPYFSMPNLTKLGLFQIDGTEWGRRKEDTVFLGAAARMASRDAGSWT